MKRLLFLLSSSLVLLTHGTNTCCDISSQTINDSMFQDCLFKELSLPPKLSSSEQNETSRSSFFYNLTRISSSPIDVKLNYLLSHHWNQQIDSFDQLILIDSLAVDFLTLDKELKRNPQQVSLLVLIKSQSIILHSSNQLSSLTHHDSWNLVISDDFILFRSNYWTINILNSWREYSGKETPLDYLSFLSFFHSHYLSPDHESIFPSAQLFLDSVLYLNSSILFQSSHSLITSLSLQDPSIDSLFLVANISPLDPFEMSLLLPRIWKSLCLGSRAEIVDDFISYEKEVPYQISDALSRLFDTCKATTSSPVTEHSSAPHIRIDLSTRHDIRSKYLPTICHSCTGTSFVASSFQFPPS